MFRFEEARYHFGGSGHDLNDQMILLSSIELECLKNYSGQAFLTKLDDVVYREREGTRYQNAFEIVTAEKSFAKEVDNLADDMANSINLDDICIQQN